MPVNVGDYEEIQPFMVSAVSVKGVGIFSLLKTHFYIGFVTSYFKLSKDTNAAYAAVNPYPKDVISVVFEGKGRMFREKLTLSYSKRPAPAKSGSDSHY